MQTRNKNTLIKVGLVIAGMAIWVIISFVIPDTSPFKIPIAIASLLLVGILFSKLYQKFKL